MQSYAAFNPEHWNIEKRAVIGGSANKEALDALNDEVEKWRTMSLRNLTFVHPAARWGSLAPRASLAFLLYLRANQARIQFLRPFFQEEVPAPYAERLIKDGINIALDSIYVLHDLNANSEIYRKQLPIFRHFLASAIALLLLILAHHTKSEMSFLESQVQVAPLQLRVGIKRATDLCTQYAQLSNASHRTWKQIQSLLKFVLDTHLFKGGQFRHSSPTPQPMDAPDFFGPHVPSLDFEDFGLGIYQNSEETETIGTGSSSEHNVIPSGLIRNEGKGGLHPAITSDELEWPQNIWNEYEGGSWI